ncbi:hypothetical protein MCOR14_001189 [Pyricularia oryzae]|nr:hypothetical protein MCOR14_001189 [Pyricularia oryzae]
MSFNDGRRYGHVPPAQYPVQNTQSQDPARRSSFHRGDDSSFLDQQGNGMVRADDELFVSSPVETHNSASTRPPTGYGATANVGMAGYQHQYQAPPTPTSYNPAQFATQPLSTAGFGRSLSTNQVPSTTRSSYNTPASPTYGGLASPTSYTPQAYNPAAYANTRTAAAPQRQATYHGYNNYTPNYNPAAPLQPSSASAAPTYGYGSPQAQQIAQPSFEQPASNHQYRSSNASNYSQHSSNASYSSQYSAPYGSSAYPSSYTGSNNAYGGSYSANGAASSSSPYQPGAPQTPYPMDDQIPAGPNYSSESLNRPRSTSQSSPLPSPQYQPPQLSGGGLQRHPTNAPLPNRPMDDVPEEWDPSGPTVDDGRLTQDNLLREIEADLGMLQHSTSQASSSQSRRPRPINGNISDDERNLLRESRLADSQGAFSTHEMSSALREDTRFQQGSTLAPPAAPPDDSLSDNEWAGGMDFGGMDLGSLGGGYAGTLSYDNNISSPPADNQSGAFADADVDFGGTGGLQSASLARAPSFDQGDEEVSVRSRRSGSESPYKEDDNFDMPDMFYHPGLSSRPLPAIPPTGSDSSSMISAHPSTRSQHHGYSQSSDAAPGLHNQLQQQQQQVERSISLSNHSSTPTVTLPGRSRTDAAEERKKAHRTMAQQAQMSSAANIPYDGFESATPSSAITYDAITLPTGRRRKFVPAKLTSGDLRRCLEPWALSGIASWIREMAEGEPDLKQKTIEEGLIKLFTTKVPTMNVADAETLASKVFDRMLSAGIIVREEEWVKFGPGTISGVLTQLTGHGCYAAKLHDEEIPGRCYSYYCTRTLKKANLDDLMSGETIKKTDWKEYHNLTDTVMISRGKKEVERQNNLHEIVYSEEVFMNHMEVLRVLYKEQLKAWQPPIITPNRLGKFIDNVFGKAEAVQQTNKEYLLAQLKYRQAEQGPWIHGFSDIFREWIRKAREPYIAFSASYPYAQFLVRREKDRNVLFRQFLDHVRSHRRSERLGWDTYLKAPITRLQRYSLLLQTVHKNSVKDDEEKANLGRAIEEIKAVTMECDKLVDDMTRQVALIELQSSLVLRPGFQSKLNLDHLGRELKMQGDLQRMGSRGVRWVETHALLFDHYFILAKIIPSKDGRSEKKYDVSKEPIPMPLLFLESMNDDPVSKQKGITAPLNRAAPTAGSGTQLNKVMSNGGDRPGLEHSNTSSSASSMQPVTRLNTTNSYEEGKILYPFRVKHLGHEVYTLYATTAQNRQEWCNQLIEAKTNYARALHAQNAEPFRLRVVADGAFAYDSISAMGRTAGVPIRGTPLDRAIREMEQVYGPGRGPAAVCRAQVNCATAFNAYGKSIIAIGTDFGVYISEASNPRGWTRSVQISKVTQIAVLEEFSVCLIIADKSLISYPLDVIAPVSNFPAPSHDSPRRAPVRLAKDVSFFATARMKDRMLVFFKRKEGMHNTFKVLEPVFQKSSEKKSRLFGGRKGGSGSTEYFRDFDEFYLPTECYSLNLLQTYIAVSTAKGFELLTLDKKQTMSIPRDLTLPAIADIAQRIQSQRPLGMFKLNDQEFLLTYEDCAVYMDKHGEVSRTLIMEYSGKQKKARAATMFGQYLLLFNEDYVEVRNAENGRLRQIIAGRDVRCLDYGYRGPTGPGQGVATGALPVDSQGTVKICMSHPEVPGSQIVLEMALNDGHLEKS